MQVNGLVRNRPDRFPAGRTGFASHGGVRVNQGWLAADFAKHNILVVGILYI
jgi:hypothetical protein